MDVWLEISLLLILDRINFQNRLILQDIMNENIIEEQELKSFTKQNIFPVANYILTEMVVVKSIWNFIQIHLKLNYIKTMHDIIRDRWLEQPSTW